jgi:phosphoribosylformylglycinamidine synthase II
MTPYEVMLSESQERMLVIVKPEHEADVRAHFERWELHCATVGVVADDGIVRVRDGDNEVVRVPAQTLTDAPTYERVAEKPEWVARLQAFDVGRLAESNGAASPSDVLLRLLASAELTSKRWVWRQYDHQVGTNTVAGPGGDAAVMRIRGTEKAIAIATDGNAAYTYLDPYTGGAIAVAEAARNVACTGARPLALTNCLNFGNPEKPDVYFQLREAVRGMADAAKALGLPVVSGNVSLYNEIAGDAIWPTPVVGAVGLLDDVARAVGHGFAREGDGVLVIGWDGRHVVPSRSKTKETLYIRRPGAALAGSQYVQLLHGIVAGKPDISLPHEAALQRFLVEAARDELLRSAHDVSAGGLAVTLAEACIAHGVGATLEWRRGGTADAAAYFGEPQSCVVVSCPPEHAERLIAAAAAQQLEVKASGTTGGERLRIGEIDVAVPALRDAYESGLPRALSERVPPIAS